LVCFFASARLILFGKWFGKKPQPLSGAPAVRREKTYSAQSGYVYQYFYRGRRPESAGTEFVFSISADRRRWRDLCVVVSAAAVEEWERSHQRDLSSTERYAVAKMALFAAFDERATPADLYQPVHVQAAGLSRIVESLGLA
jgi:hypothetical protein